MATTTTTTTTISSTPLSFSNRFIHPYDPPVWAKDAFSHFPLGRLKLAHLPTPLYLLSTSSSSSTKNWLQSSLLQEQQHQQPLQQLQFWIKRDDMTGGLELGGNKIRKLEFLLADALQQNCDAVVTIGGRQSNHVRATAAAARMIGIEPHLILRQSITSTTTTTTTTPSSLSTTSSPSNSGCLIGNLLIDRMVASHIYTCTPGEYGRIGSDELVRRVGHYVQTQLQKVPYLIPVGGSNALGSWGYLQAVDELLQQWNDMHYQQQQQQHHHHHSEHKDDNDDDEDHNTPSIDHIVLACGSGGTAAGVCLGMALAHGAFSSSTTDDTQPTKTSRRPPPPHIHAIGVCDDPDYFYRHIAQIALDMGLNVLALPLPLSSTTTSTTTTTTTTPASTTTTRPTATTSPTTSTLTDTNKLAAMEEFIRQHLTVYQGKGLGYAQSTRDELEFVANFAQDTGIVLDPVYTGKALYHFVHQVLPLLLLSKKNENSNSTNNNSQHDNRKCNVLFWHTGGGLGLYDKADDLLPLLQTSSPIKRLLVYGKSNDNTEEGGVQV